MAYKQKSPYKFLGKLAKGIGGAVGGAASKIFGGGGGGGGAMDPNKAALLGGIAGGPMGMLMGNKMAGGRGMPFMKKQGYTPYTKPDSKSPFKTDAILVKGAGKAASANDTAKYAIIAKSRAFSDMVDSVEKTVNRSSAAQLQKDTTRAKRTARAHDRYGDWKERYDRREHERDRHKQKRRSARDKYRQDVLGKPATKYAEYGSYDPTTDHGGTNTQGLYPYNYD